LSQSIETIDPESIKFPLDFGILKGSGLNPDKKTLCVPRTGVLPENFFKDTLD
jgi:hypothetical protein